MNIVQGYAHSVLVPQLQSIGLNERQRAIVVADVTMRLESLLSHWRDLRFRNTILVLGAEEASFWEPRDATMEIRSLIVVAVRNSLIEDLHSSHPYTQALLSVKRLSDAFMPQITSEAVRYFQASNLDALSVQPTQGVFGALPQRFPNAWHALSLLANSSGIEIACEMPATEPGLVGVSETCSVVDRHSVVASGIDPRLDSILAKTVEHIEQGKLDLFFSSSFRGITRNPEKLLSIIDRILRHGGMLLTPNYLLSPSYMARRIPLLRPAQYEADLQTQIRNPIGLSERHEAALMPFRC